MSDLPAITGKEAIRAFAKAGFHQDRVKGSHHILKKAGHLYHLSVPMHSGKTLGKGLLRRLIHDAGMSEDEFLRLL
jgi:predicted RNA binding protein YcfA (HicA-like mRNA interferase family)